MTAHEFLVLSIVSIIFVAVTIFRVGLDFHPLGIETAIAIGQGGTN